MKKWLVLFVAGFSVSLFAGDGFLWVVENHPYNKEIKSFQVKFLKISSDGKKLLFSSDKINGLVYGTAADNKNKRGFFYIGNLISINENGKIKTIKEHLRGVMGLAYDEKNDILWVAETGRDRILRLKMEGDKIKEEKVIKGFKRPAAVVVDKADSSVWVADAGIKNPDNPGKPPSWVVKLDKDGNRILSLKGYNFLAKDMKHIGVSGKAIAITKENVLVCDFSNNRIVILSKEGETKKEIPSPSPNLIAVSSDGNLWVNVGKSAEKSYPRELLKISQDGKILFKKPISSFDICPVEDGCWVATGGKGLTFIDNSGKTTLFGAPKYSPCEWELKGKATKILYIKGNETPEK